MKVGIATPCHAKDTQYLNLCLDSIDKLDPKPYRHLIDINNGERSLHEIRTGLYDQLFQSGCDVVLSCDADFWLFPQILFHVRRNITTSFCQLEKRFFADLIMKSIHLVYPDSWTGCYSMPKETWKKDIKPFWDGDDGSIKKLLGRNVKFVRKPLYYVMRPWRSTTTKRLLADKTVLEKLKWRAMRLR